MTGVLKYFSNYFSSAFGSIRTIWKSPGLIGHLVFRSASRIHRHTAKMHLDIPI